MSLKRRLRRWRMRRQYPWWSSDAPPSGDRPFVDVASEADPMAPPEPLEERALAPKPMRLPGPLEPHGDGRWLFEHDDEPPSAEAEPGEAAVLESEPAGQDRLEDEAGGADDVAESFAAASEEAERSRPDQEAPESDVAVPVADVGDGWTADAIERDDAQSDEGGDAVPEPMAMREPPEPSGAPHLDEGDPAMQDPTAVWGKTEPAAVDEDLASPPEDIGVDEPAAAVDAGVADRAVVDPDAAELDRTSDGGPSREEIERLEERIARVEAVEARVEEIAAGTATSARLEALEERVDQVAGDSERVSRLEKAVQAIVPRLRRLDEVRRELVEVRDGLGGVEEAEQHVRALGAEVETLRSALSKAAGRTKGVEDLDARTRALDSRVRQVEDTRPRLEQVQRQVRGLEGAAERLDRLELEVRGLERTASQLEDLEERVASIGPAALRAKDTEDAVRTVVARVRELMKLSGRVGELERRLPAELGQRLEEIARQVAATQTRVDDLGEAVAETGAAADAAAADERLARIESDLRGRISAVETWIGQLERTIVSRLDELGESAPATAAGATLQDAIAALRTELDVLRGQGTRR